MKKNIALVAGGYSGEYVISVKSAAVIERNIDSNIYNVYKIEISKKSWADKGPDGPVVIYEESWTHIGPDGQAIAVDKNDFSLTINGKKVKFDAVFIGIHGTPGEDGRLQGYFEMLGIPFTSCGMVTSALTFNKSYCNKVVAALNVVNVSKSVHIFKDQPYDTKAILQELKLPVFVKPAEGGSSIGMSKVNKADELQDAITKAFNEDAQILIEEFVKGREITCGLYRVDGEFTVLPLTEIISSKEFFDYEAKYVPGMSKEVTPAEVPEEVATLIGKTAEELYNRLNCRGIVRMDFIWEESGKRLFFLEVNTMPGQSENSIVPQMVRAAGKTLQEFYGTLIEDCLKRF